MTATILRIRRAIGIWRHPFKIGDKVTSRKHGGLFTVVELWRAWDGSACTGVIKDGGRGIIIHFLTDSLVRVDEIEIRSKIMIDQTNKNETPQPEQVTALEMRVAALEKGLAGALERIAALEAKTTSRKDQRKIKSAPEAAPIEDTWLDEPDAREKYGSAPTEPESAADLGERAAAAWQTVFASRFLEGETVPITQTRFDFEYSTLTVLMPPDVLERWKPHYDGLQQAVNKQLDSVLVNLRLEAAPEVEPPDQPKVTGALASVIKVGHIKPNGGVVVYVGRRNTSKYLEQSPYANPFKMADPSAAERQRVIDAYREWFYADEQAELRDRARLELAGKQLACWCAPLPCHADILAEFVNSEQPAPQPEGEEPPQVEAAGLLPPLDRTAMEAALIAAGFPPGQFAVYQNGLEVQVWVTLAWKDQLAVKLPEFAFSRTRGVKGMDVYNVQRTPAPQPAPLEDRGETRVPLSESIPNAALILTAPESGAQS